MRTGMIELCVILSRRYKPPTLIPNFMPFDLGRDSNSILIVLHSSSASVTGRNVSGSEENKRIECMFNDIDLFPPKKALFQLAIVSLP